MRSASFSVKQAFKSAVLCSGILRLCSSFRSSAAVILGYHSVSADRVGQDDYISQAITVGADRFAEQMRILRQYYYPVTLDDIADWISGAKTLPPRAAAVTFDDGFEDNYTVAAPIMEQYRIHGTFYLTVNYVTKKELPWFSRKSRYI
jgi:peptidoglycan/xylan/chitin deacetylase (PgdA/CDA1 family)